MPNPFKKKPDDEETPDHEGGGAPKPPPSEGRDAPKPPSSEPSSEGGDAPAKGKGGTSAPVTPNQGVPDVKPHDQPGAKAEAEESPQGKDELPDETDDAPAKEKPQGLPSVAMMTKEEAVKGSEPQVDPMEHINKLTAIIEGLANHVKGMGTAPSGVGGTNTMGAKNVAQNMSGKPAAGMRPGMGKPGMMTGKPGIGGGIGGAPAPAKMLTMEQITGLMGILEAANTGRIPRAGASLLIAQGFGMDPQTAMQMVSPDVQDGTVDEKVFGEEPVEEESSLFDGPDALNPEEEELEGGGEEEFEDPEEEEELKKSGFGSNWDFKKLDSEDIAQDTLKRLEAERDRLDERIDAVEKTMEVLGIPFV